MAIADELLAKIAAKLEALGYVRKESTPGNDWYATYYKPEKTKILYYGTYLNPFSCGEWCERPGKLYLWNDSIVRNEATITLWTVNKHNGAVENTSVDVIVNHTHIERINYFGFSPNDLKNKIFMRELAKSPKPITKVAYPDVIKKNVLKIRLLKNATDRKIDNAIKKAVEVFESFVPEERTDELDRADFPKDTSKEYFEQEKTFREKEKSV